MRTTDRSPDEPTSLLNPLPFTRGEGVDCSSTAANKFRYPASREGRARHSVRAVPGTPCKPRRARSGAPHPVTELNCHGTRLGSARAGDSSDKGVRIEAGSHLPAAGRPAGWE